MANQPPAGRWMRMATLRPMSNPTQDPPSPQPPAPRPAPGRTFTAVPFRPVVPTVPAPVAAMPPAPVTAPPRQVTPTLPTVTSIRPPSVRLAAGTNGIPPPQGAPITTSASNGGPSPQRAYTTAAATNGVPSPQGAPNAAITNGSPSLQSPQRTPAALMPNVKLSPQPAPPPVPVDAVPSPPKSQVAPTASPASPMTARNGAQVNSPPAPPTSTNTPPPVSKAPYSPTFHMPKSPSQKSPQLPSAGYGSPAVLPSPQKQAASPPYLTSTTTSAPAPRMVTFSNAQTFSSPTKPQVSPAASTPRVPSPKISPPNTSNPPDRTPPQSPKTMTMAPPPSPLRLPPPQLRSDIEQDHHEPEQKSILFQQTSAIKSHDKPHADSSPNHKSPQITKHENHTKPTTKDRLPHKTHSDSDDINRSIITIAGENRGAFMNLTRPRTTHPHPQFQGNPHKLTSPNSKINGSESDQSSGSNGKPKPKDAVSSAMKSFMNSNVQGINNSIMFNSTVTHHDPGVHVALSRKHQGHGGLIRHNK